MQPQFLVKAFDASGIVDMHTGKPSIEKMLATIRRTVPEEEAKHARESLTTLVPLAAQQYLTDEDHDAVGTAHDLDEHGNVADRPAKINNESAMRAKCLSVQHQRDARLEWSQRVQQKQDDDAACKEQKVNNKLKDNASWEAVLLGGGSQSLAALSLARFAVPNLPQLQAFMSARLFKRLKDATGYKHPKKGKLADAERGGNILILQSFNPRA